MKIDDSFGDKIFIRQLVVEAILGILPAERLTPQPVHIDITVLTNTSHPAKTKEIADAVDYAALADAAAGLTINGEYLLIETLAEDLAALCLAKPHVAGVCVRVEKPQAVAAATAVGVEIYRSNSA